MEQERFGAYLYLMQFKLVANVETGECFLGFGRSGDKVPVVIDHTSLGAGEVEAFRERIAEGQSAGEALSQCKTLVLEDVYACRDPKLWMISKGEQYGFDLSEYDGAPVTEFWTERRLAEDLAKNAGDDKGWVVDSLVQPVVKQEFAVAPSREPESYWGDDGRLVVPREAARDLLGMGISNEFDALSAEEVQAKLDELLPGTLVLKGLEPAANDTKDREGAPSIENMLEELDELVR